MSRATTWSLEVENSFRLQEAGFRGVEELRALGLEEPEVWPDSGFIRKLQTKTSFEKGQYVMLYFRKVRECEPKHVNRVKLYRFA